MQLSKQLVLFRFILRQFGYETFEDLRDEFNRKEAGVSSTGYTLFAGSLMANTNKLVDDRLIQQYDEAIQGYEKRLRENRAEPLLSFKYFQWFALLFSEFFFEAYSQNQTHLINALNEFLRDHKDLKEIEPYIDSDLKKLAYWMATGSGKTLREHLTRGEGSITFEYSATFGQIITGSSPDLLQEYGKSIIFDYSYRHFYTDGYGKDFAVFNLDTKNEYSDEQNKLLLTASLLGFYEQLELFDRNRDELRRYNIEKPLWIFVGSRVISSTSSSLTRADKENISDVSRIVKFFRYALANPSSVQQRIDNILSDNSGLRDDEGNDIFIDRFKFLREERPKAEVIFNKVFNGIGAIDAFQIKQADGEIALKTKTSDQYFAVINIGDVPKYVKTLEEDTEGELTIQDDNFTRSLFHNISEKDSTINILIGSKKFIEGWNSWRVSSMGLMNMGKGEGPQIIQLFGRGVRLKGKNLSLKREETGTAYPIKALQTISIMGLNASYMNRFLEEIEKEVPQFEERRIEIKFNREEQWNGKILTFRKETGKDFRNELIEFQYNPEVARRITIDLRNKISMAVSGFKSQVADEKEFYHQNFLKKFSAFIDFNALFLEANRYKLVRGYRNLIINQETIFQLIEDDNFNLFSHKGQFELEEAISGKVQAIAVTLVHDYINKFYADKEKEFLSKHLTYDMLDHSEHAEMFPASGNIVVKIPKTYGSFISELESCIRQIYEKDDKTLPSIHFDRHLYSPIASMADGNKFKEIKTIPVRLNEGERDFLQHLKEYVRESKKFEGKEIFVLRNLSGKGLGFFMESSSFYPDFIVWVIDGNKQHIFFLDPKGILLGETHFNNPKVLWCKNVPPEIEKKIQQDLNRDKRGITVSVSAFILSVTLFGNVGRVWSDGNVTKEDFEQNHIVFIEDNKEYLNLIFKDI